MSPSTAITVRPCLPGQRLDRRTAHRWVRAIGKRAGLGPVHPRMLRAASIMADDSRTAASSGTADDEDDGGEAECGVAVSRSTSVLRRSWR